MNVAPVRVLFVSVCVSVVPTMVPLGAGTPAFMDVPVALFHFGKFPIVDEAGPVTLLCASAENGTKATKKARMAAMDTVRPAVGNVAC